MPGSAISAGSGSIVSSGSRRAKTRSYHKVANTSQVDESLFGTPHRETQRATMLEDKFNTEPTSETRIEREAAARSAKRKNGNKKGKRETVQVVTKDLIRNLLVPREDPSGASMVLSYDQLLRIKSSARVLSEGERHEALEAFKREKQRLQDDVQERKDFMKLKDLQRQKNTKLNDLEEEEQVKAEHLRARANEQLQEQEDEIKHLNELILNAKCHAIRDAQILEKSQVKEEMGDEEKRLDTMMEVDRVNSIKVEEGIERKKKKVPTATLR